MMSAVTPQTLQGGHVTLVSALAWVRQYSGESYNSRNRGQALAVRPDGSIIVTGYSYAPYTPGTGYDFVTLAYAPDGTPLWTNRYDSPEHGDDTPFLVASGGSGDVWVAGHSATNWSIGDAVLLRYSSNGLPAWAHLSTSFNTRSGFATALGVDR